MNRMANVLNGNAPSQDQSVVKVWRCAWFLGVHSDQAELLPQRLQQIVQVQLHVATDDNAVWLPGQTIHLLDGNLIDLVVHIETGQIDAIGRHHIDELVLRAVFAEQNFGVEDLKRVQNSLHHFLVAPSDGARRVVAQASALL